MATRRLRIGVLAILILAGAGPAPAREAARRDFGGGGWNQADLAEAIPLTLSLAGVVRGAISFDLQRVGDVAALPWQTVFSLVDGAGVQVLRVQVRWTGEAGQGAPRLAFRGPGGGEEYLRYGIGLWGPVVELDRTVEPGAWIHVDLTWDDEARAYGVYVDGRLQDRRSGGPPGEALFSAEMLEKVNRKLEREGKAEVFASRPLGAFVGGVTSVRLGSSGPPQPAAGAAPPGDGSRRPYLRDARIEAFAVHAGEVPPPGPPPGPAIASVGHDAFRAAGFSGRLVAGNTLAVTLTGTPGAVATFDLVHYPGLDGRVRLDWRGWGVYLEEKPFFDEGEVDLRGVEGYLVYASREPFDPAAPALAPVARLEVGEQEYTLEMLDVDAPCYAAVLAEMRDGTRRTVIAPVAGRPMVETAPGVYAGSYAVGYADRYPRAAVVGRLSRGARAAALLGPRELALDPSLTLTVETEPDVLPADETSSARVTVTVRDANGDEVAGHRVRFLLATTSQYTGVVGGGAFAEQVGGTLGDNAWGETDIFGRLTVAYTAGFAAKTAVIVARDMASNDTGAGYVTTFIRASAGLELAPLAPALGAEGYELALASSDAWLTADGRSQARVTATVTLRGAPVAGHRIAFAVASGGGSVRTVSDTTDHNGRARAVYTAGTKIGVALVTAADLTVDLAASVPIELRSDAPAKIVIRIEPERLPADGSSRAEVSVVVTDVNDNPNDNVAVEYQLAGPGRLADERTVTDRRGETGTRYVAGDDPGPVTIEITVRSAAPTEGELAAARALAVAVTDYDFF